MADLNILTLYITDIHMYPLLSREDEFDLAKRKAEGDKEARDLLICSTLRFVAWIAKKYCTGDYGISYLDLIQEGNIGLIRAVDTFDYSKGYRLTTFAYKWVRTAILSAIDRERKASIFPRIASKLLRKMQRTRSKLKKELGRWPTDEEIAVSMGVAFSVVSQLKECEDVKPVSISTRFCNDEDADELIDFLADTSIDADVEAMIIRNEERARLLELIEMLKPKEREVLRWRCGLMDGNTYTLREVQTKLGGTTEGIRQIEKRAVRRLKKMYGKDFPEFL